MAVIISSCLKSKKPGIPQSTQEILNRSGIFKPGLMSVILEFQEPKDSLKLRCAYYLIENLDNNYTIKQSLADSLNNPIDLNILDFPDLSTIRQKRDSIERIIGNLKYKTDTIWLDFKYISPSFLISHINSSYTNWKNNVLLKEYNFETFCNYILPYRVANEEPEFYLDQLRSKFNYLFNSDKSLKQIIFEINDEINSNLSYDERLVMVPNAQSIKQTEKNQSGDLRDINIYKTMVYRSLGIAAALDYTPYFCDSILGYYTTTVILPNKDEIHLSNPDNNFNPYEEGKVAKVYRREYNSNPTSLFSIKDKKKHTPDFLGNFDYIDVTNEYIPTKSITILIRDTSRIVYLSVYNDKAWKPVEWSIIRSDSTAIFENMGLGVRYMPSVVIDKTIVPIGEEFFLK